MMEIVRQLIREKHTVKIFTARACDPEQFKYVEKWLDKHDLSGIMVTSKKDYGMHLLYDDRAVQVEYNTGVVHDTRLEYGKLQ